MIPPPFFISMDRLLRLKAEKTITIKTCWSYILGYIPFNNRTSEIVNRQSIYPVSEVFDFIVKRLKVFGRHLVSNLYLGNSVDFSFQHDVIYLHCMFKTFKEGYLCLSMQ